MVVSKVVVVVQEYRPRLSAIANAENNLELNRDSLYVAETYANQGPTLKRYWPRSRKYTLINAILSEEEVITINIQCIVLKPRQNSAYTLFIKGIMSQPRMFNTRPCHLRFFTIRFHVLI